MSRRDDARGISEGVAVLTSAVVGLVVASASVWFFSGPFDTSFESLYRVDPASGGDLGGIGADWTAGNTDPLLDLLVALTHAADVIMGAFVLLLVFIHWGAFRRIASRMQEPDQQPAGEGVAADGGHRPDQPPAESRPSDGGDGE
jgi:hypothetical protein